MLEFPSFLRWNNIPFVGTNSNKHQTPRFVYPLLHWWTLGLFPHYLSLVMLLWIEVFEYFFKTLLSMLPTLLEVDLLDHMVALVLIFWGTAILFSTMAAPFYIPTNRAQGFQCFYILANTCSVVWCFVLIIGILMCVKCKEEHFYAKYFRYGK